MKRMDLSAEEAQKMEAIQKEFQEQMKEQRREEELLIKKLKMRRKEKYQNEAEFTEEEAKEALTKRLEMEEVRIKMEREYTERIISAISAKKTLEYKKYEREFKKELLEMLRDEEKHHHMRRELVDKERHQQQMKKEKMNE